MLKYDIITVFDLYFLYLHRTLDDNSMIWQLIFVLIIGAEIYAL